uniref:Uncharacterized protein n=1 Tax=Panagrolaimus davidi TaxID=227884 RepID=A0A914PTG3_9BILA
MAKEAPSFRSLYELRRHFCAFLSSSAFVERLNESIEVTIVSYETEKIMLKLKFDKIKDFTDKMENLFKSKFKAVIFDVFYVKSSEHSNNTEFCYEIEKKLDELNIPFYFMNRNGSILSRLLINGNISAKLNEIILITWIQSEKLLFFKLKFTENGYIILEGGDENLDLSKAKEIRKTIIGDLNPQKIFFFPTTTSESGLLKQESSIRKILKSKKLFICKIDESKKKFIVESYKWILDKSSIKFHVCSLAVRKYEIGFKMGGKKNTPLIVCNVGMNLPFEKVKEIPNGSMKFYLAYTESGKTHELHTFELERNAHRFNLTLFVDENNMPHFKLKPFLFQSILTLPPKLDKNLETKIPVISFFDNSSVICVYKENSKSYQFLESWNGEFGRELLIAFDKEEISYCNDAIETYRTKPSFVICDLLKIMSMPINEVLAIKTLDFSITKDSENPVIFEFDNFDGTKKFSTPAFLMALLLKQHIKVIKNEMNEKPKMLCFCFPSESIVENRKRIEKYIEESCKLLKISCEFLEI